MQKDVLHLMHDPGRLSTEKQTLLSNVAAQAAVLGLPCYLVGGFVRDLLLGRPVNDFDIVVEGDAIKFGESLVKKYGGKLTTHQKFHTAIWHFPGVSETLDLITARKETYSTAGALPSVLPSTIEDDLRRRDFAMNAMALRLDGDYFGSLLDPLNGRSDLESRTIRALHPRSFIDDPTRIFRAVRYEGRYAFQLEPSTAGLINSESIQVIMRLSGERIRHELDLIFEEDNAAKIIQRAGGLGVFPAIHPKLPPFDPNYFEFLEMDPTLDVPANRPLMGYMLWLMDRPEEDLLSICRRLDFSIDMTHAVWAVAQLKKSLPFLVDSQPSIWAFALEKLPLLSIYTVYLITRETALLDYISIWRHVKAHTTGDDLIQQGLIPGPRFGEILSQLRAAWLDGVVQSAQEERDLLERLIKSN